jgi:enoyl-CoA hydratase
MADLKIEKFDRVATVIMDRPPVNALTLALFENIFEVFQDLGTSFDVNCVILTGAGTRAFCAGLDLNDSFSATLAEDLKRRRAYSAVYHCKVPVIAAVNGPALGAGSLLASVCDIRIAADRATFGLPEINVGRCGGGAHHGRLIPQGALRRMFFTGSPISTEEAYRIGLVDQIVKPVELLPAARALSAVIASKSPLGLRLGKKVLNEIESVPFEEGYALEQRYSAKLLETEDAKEAKRALIEKRMPVFVGR